MKKKLLSLAMALAMALSLACPAFANYFTHAAENEINSLDTAPSIEFTARTFVPTIKLTLPGLVSTSSPVVLNPYKLKFTGTDNTLNNVAVGSGADQYKQVISPVYSIKNETNVALKFAVKADTERNSNDFTFTSNHVALSATAKQAYIALVIKKTEASTAGIGTSSEQTMDPLDTANNEVLVLGDGAKNTQPAQIKKLAPALNASGATAANYLQFQFQGSLSRTPNTGWTADDTFTTTLEFTFTPESGNDYTGTVALATGSTTTLKGAKLANAIVIDPAATTGSVTHSGGAADATYATFTEVGTNPAAAPKGPSGAAVTKVADMADPTAPNWSLLSAGAFGATIDTSNGKITYPDTTGETLDGSRTGKANTDTLVVGFTDFNGVPRTIGLTTTITHTVS